MLQPVLTVLALAFVSPAAAAEDGLASLEMQPVELPRRDGSTVTVERGRLRVPIVRSKPDSKPIEIDVWRFPAREDRGDTPPIFRLHGGPGWPGIEPSDVDYDGDIAVMTRSTDLVVVGQRGIGTSTNLGCDGMLPPLAVDAPVGDQDMALVTGCLNCREHWEGQGYDLSGLNVIEAANDVDDVRRLLGYDEITLWGESFGSHWAMATMRYFPGGVARALLGGTEGPDHTYDAPTGVLNALERIAEAAEASPVIAPHVPEGGLIAAFREVIARAEEKPFEVVAGGEVRTIDADNVRDMALGLRARVSSRRGVPTWPADIIALWRGDLETATRVVGEAAQRDANLPTAAFFMLDCGSGITDERLAKLKADPAAAVVGDLTHWYETACSAWGADLGDDFRTGFATNIPTVIVHGTWDTSTPFENALELQDSFGELSFVVVEGGSHGALGEAIRESDEFEAELWEFLLDGDRDGLPGVVELSPIAWVAPE